MSDPSPTVIVQPVAAPPAIKPGWLTSEHILTLVAMLLSALYATGALPTSGTVAQVVAIAATMLGALGYQVSRTLVKTASAP